MSKFYIILFIIFIFLGFIVVQFSKNTLARFEEMDRISDKEYEDDIIDDNANEEA